MKASIRKLLDAPRPEKPRKEYVKPRELDRLDAIALQDGKVASGRQETREAR